MQPPKSPLTFRQPSVISRMFSAHGITLQPDAFTTLPAEILSRTHTPSKIKKTTATIWPYSKHGKHFSTFPPWRTKDKNKQGVITNLALQRLFHKASMRLFYLQLLYWLLFERLLFKANDDVRVTCAVLAFFYGHNHVSITFKWRTIRSLAEHSTFLSSVVFKIPEHWVHISDRIKLKFHMQWLARLI